MLRLCSFMQQPQGLHAQIMKSIPSFRGLQKIMWIILVEVSQPWKVVNPWLWLEVLFCVSGMQLLFSSKSHLHFWDEFLGPSSSSSLLLLFVSFDSLLFPCSTFPPSSLLTRPGGLGDWIRVSREKGWCSWGNLLSCFWAISLPGSFLLPGSSIITTVCSWLGQFYEMCETHLWFLAMIHWAFLLFWD